MTENENEEPTGCPICHAFWQCKCTVEEIAAFLGQTIKDDPEDLPF